MVTSQVKYVFISIFYMVLFFEESVNADQSSNEALDFREVIAENSQYLPVKDMCTRRVIGGHTVDIEEVPYQILIVQCDSECDYWKLVCGGAIVTRQHVVSAGHCFRTKDVKTNYRVVAGTGQPNMLWNRRLQQDANSRKMSSEIWRQILHCFIHTHSKSRQQHDFAVLENYTLRIMENRLNNLPVEIVIKNVSLCFIGQPVVTVNNLDIPMNFSKFVQPIPMLKTSYNIELKEGDLCTVTGFGETEKGKMSRYLRMVCLPFVPRDKCVEIFGFIRLAQHQFCAGDWGRDSCKGDSGGPITFRGYLIGIVSYGEGICGHGPGIYTKISTYTTGEKIPLYISQSCVMLSLNIIKVVCFVFSIFVHNFVVSNFFIFNKFCA